jgi:hypothetical protein
MRREGWEYACAKCIDLETGGEVYLVSINRGNEKLTSLWPTLEEAAKSLSRLVV